MENCLESPEAIEYSLAKKVKTPVILDLLNVNENDVTLDVGSGGGYFTRILAEKSKKVIGLDRSIVNAKSSKKSIEKLNVYFVIGDATRLPFKNNIFNNILAAEIIEHIEDDILFVKECQRTLIAGGSVVITTPCTNPTIPIEWLRRISGVDLKSDFGHVRGGYTKNEIESIININNLKIMNIDYSFQFFTEFINILTYFGRTIHSGGKKWTDGRNQSKLIETNTFKLYKVIFPILFHFSKLDKLLHMCKGYHIVIKASKIN